jgi:NitT/TauT family transport system ATP-binding protein
VGDASHGLDLDIVTRGPGTGPASVVVQHLSKSFPAPRGEPLRVLDDISMSVQPGEFVAIVGPSGCGKTTLLRMIQGLDSPDGGNVSIAGEPAGAVASGFVFQRPSLFPWRTVERNVAFGLELAVASGRETQRLSKAQRRDRVAHLLQLTGLAEFADYYPRQISGGMQQRVNLARALTIEPVVLLMDEPFSALDAQTRERLQCDLQDIVVETGTTALLITHDIREAVFQADRVYVMAARPGRFTHVLEIEEPRPRGPEYQQSDRLAERARRIWKLMHDVG